VSAATLLAGGLLPTLLLLAAAGLQAAESTEASGPAVTVGVAPFEKVAPSGDTPPDLCQLLAQRIGTLGVARVVGPDQLGAAALAEPDSDTVRAWASGAEVAAIAVGRTTRVGTQLSVDVRLRSGESGNVAGTYVAEILRPEQLGPAVDRLAAQIVDGTVALLAAGRSPPASVAGGSGSEDASSDSDRKSLFALGAFDSSEPLTIHSDALDAYQEEGMRRLVFTKNVRVTQADMTLSSDRLVAFYPEDGGEPDRLVADGRVVLVRGAREARCDHASYDRVARRLVCRGGAELRDGEDRLRGEVIEFEIESDRVVVSGGATILFHPERDGSEPPEGAAP
jgi:lipopolysaccharide export system protein LptA